MAPQTTTNPFYVLLVLAGIVFFVTATTYGVMTVKGLYPEEQIASSVREEAKALGDSGLMKWMDKNGFQLLMIELGVLAACTFAAIGTDNYWSKKKTTKP